jgi:predicted esterase
MTRPRPRSGATEHHIEVPRSARYFQLGVPSGADEIWFVLHGFGQLGGEFIGYFVDLANGKRAIVAPEALNRYYTVGLSVPAQERPVGATWMTREDRENEMRDYVRYLDLLHARVTLDHPGARTIVLGFSQGGATASRWATRGDAQLDRLILWGATVPPDLDLSAGSKTFRGARLTLVVGDRDQYVAPDAVDREDSRLREAGIPFDLTRFDGGHSIKRSVLAEIAR